eukprot:TRINITY_DN12231_c0_g1_i2.p1 TRINITY_DN12231_c0_g1~~TRINITY_DN12231_c0_g1_i2.p1  ORF type:complete len:311 (+),score=50.77 TRINITY_DN12231_c0_g1_i2:56-988(+)
MAGSTGDGNGSRALLSPCSKCCCLSGLFKLIAVPTGRLSDVAQARELERTSRRLDASAAVPRDGLAEPDDTARQVHDQETVGRTSGELRENAAPIRPLDGSFDDIARSPPLLTSSPTGVRRDLQPVRRGVVRGKQAHEQVAVPSVWEHVEVEVTKSSIDGSAPARERVATLVLTEAGRFQASIGERQCGSTSAGNAVFRAHGEWRRSRGYSLELIFPACAYLDLHEELIVVYRLRRGCLIAEASSLPDGLAQEYSRCTDTSSADILKSLPAVGDDPLRLEAKDPFAGFMSSDPSEEEYPDDFENESDEGA